MKKIGVAIIGGTGYGAGEMMRYLACHPHAEVVSVVSATKAGSAVSESHSFLTGFSDLTFDDSVNIDALKAFEHKVIFVPLPHGVSAVEVPNYCKIADSIGGKLVDLSGDYRLRDAQVNRVFYGDSNRSEELMGRFVYGLPEIARDKISSATFVCNPGCLASSCILSAAPFASHVTGSIVFDAKTGLSGGGRAPSEVTHLPSRHGSMQAYKVLSHRHEPEIVQGLSDICGHQRPTFFVPHLLPVSRGIYVTAYFEVEDEMTRAEAESLCVSFYERSSFVRLRKSPPELRDVIGSNFFDISVEVRGRQVVVMGALDNLGKGMATNAIQNMNIMCGLDETQGLYLPSIGIA